MGGKLSLRVLYLGLHPIEYRLISRLRFFQKELLGWDILLERERKSMPISICLVSVHSLKNKIKLCSATAISGLNKPSPEQAQHLERLFVTGL